MRPENEKTDVKNVVEEKPVVQAEPRTVFGIVEHCERLNVRAAPSMNAEVACVIKCHAKVEIDLEKSTEDFYKVTVPSGVGGFCMKKFIEIQQ